MQKLPAERCRRTCYNLTDASATMFIDTAGTYSAAEMENYVASMLKP
jgi:hypothetical protein